MNPISDPILIFAVVMVTILVAPLVFQKLKVPGLLGLICAGTVIGPSVSGLLERDATIELLGAVGLVYLMFTAGLSLDLAGFLKNRNRSLGFGLLSFTLPFSLALMIGPAFLGYTLTSAVLLGSIVGSHTLLAYPIVSRLGIMKSRGVTVAMGGTLVTDVLSLGILAVVIASATGEAGWDHWLLFALRVAVFVAGTVVLLPLLGRWFFRTIKYDSTTDFVFLVAVVFITAHLAETAGLAPIIGAFMAGLLMNRLVPESGTLMSRVKFVGNALFVPFFLVSVGMLVDVAVLGRGEVWLKATVFTVLVAVGKSAAAILSARLFGFSKAEGGVVVGLTIPQAAATLAVTLLGFEHGLFGQGDVNAVILMILATCLIGPSLVEKFGREVAIQEEAAPYDPSEAPQRILVPLANPDTASHLMEIAFMVHDEKGQEPIYPLAVTQNSANVVADVARKEKMLNTAVEYAAAAEMQVIPITRIDLNVAKGISRAVYERRISTVIIGWNGELTTHRTIFGSILDQLLEETDVLVMVCKIARPINLFERLVVAVPPLASWEFGFPEAVRSIKLLAEHMGIKPLFLSAGETFLRERVEGIAPQLDTEWDDLESWSQLPDWLVANSVPTDLFVLLSAKQGALSWRSSLNRLPGRIAARLPDICFIIVYPAEPMKTGSGPLALA